MAHANGTAPYISAGWIIKREGSQDRSPEYYAGGAASEEWSPNIHYALVFPAKAEAEDRSRRLATQDKEHAYYVLTRRVPREVALDQLDEILSYKRLAL